MNHGEKWQKLAELVSDCYGVDITRTSSDDEKLGVEYANEVRLVKEQNIKTFTIQCVDCGAKTIRHGMRSPKWYIHPDWYKCSKCGGKLEKVVDK